MNWMIIAFVVGIVVGLLSGIKLIDHVLLLFFHRHFLFDGSYGSLYDRLDHKSNYEMMQNQPNPPKSYAEFLSLHEKQRPGVGKEFKCITRDVTKYLSIGYLIVLALAIIFTINWYWYVLGVLVAHMLHAIHRVWVREHRQGFYVTLMLLTIVGKSSPKK